MGVAPWPTVITQSIQQKDHNKEQEVTEDAVSLCSSCSSELHQAIQGLQY